MSYDAVVVGGGIAGASVAWALADRGATVCLVEREAQAGQHATGRSAAVTNETVGHPLVCRLAAASRAFLDAPPPGFADHPLVAPRGLLWVTDDPATLDAVDPGSPAVRRIEGDEVLGLVPVLRPPWAGVALHEPGAMAVDVAALLQGYLRGLRRSGGHVRLGAEAVRLTPGWRVELPDVTLRCGVVVNAAGAWGDEVACRAGVAPLGLTPRRRTACIVRVPAGHDVTGWPLVMDAGGRFYAEPEPGGLLLSPADEAPAEPGDTRPDELDVARALDRLREATALPVRSVVRAWAGLRTFAPDRAPVAGFDPDHPGFYWLVGQGGGGIKTAPALAALAAADITGTLPPFASPDALRPGRLRG